MEMKFYSSFLKLSWLVLVVSTFTFTSIGFSLEIYPTRLVLTDRTRVVELELKHTEATTTRYDVSLVFFRMLPNGDLQDWKDPPDSALPAMKYLRYSPHSVTLTQNSTQVVKVMLIPSKDLPDGDYRAHLKLSPAEEANEELAKPLPGKNKVSLSLTMKLSITVPVIFKHGQTSYKVALSDLKMVKQKNGMLGYSLKMKSTGNGIPYGSVSAFFTPKGGEKQRIAYVKGISAYIPERTLSYPLTELGDTRLEHGTLTVEFASEEEGGKVIDAIEGKIP